MTPFICYNQQTKIIAHALVLWGLTILLTAQTGPNPPGHDHRIESITEAESPENSARTRLGVGEKISLTFEHYPDETVNSSKISGGGNLIPTQQGHAEFTAPENFATGNQNTVIEARCSKGGRAKITFEIVKPSGVIMEIDSRTPQKNPLMLTTLTKFYILPDDVNFSKIWIRKDNCSAFATGYWASRNGQPHFGLFSQPTSVRMLHHVPNKGTLADGIDKIQSVTSGPAYSPGTFNRPIPWRYAVNSNQGVFTIVPHIALIDSDNNSSTLRHTKAQMDDSVSTP